MTYKREDKIFKARLAAIADRIQGGVMINELQPSTLTRNRHTIENDRREVRHVSERLQEILDEASRKVREWPEWKIGRASCRERVYGTV